MFTKWMCRVSVVALLMGSVSAVFAQKNREKQASTSHSGENRGKNSSAHEHGGAIFHAFRLQLDAGHKSHAQTIQKWDFDGWIGGDDHKLWLKSEGERARSKLESAEVQALYSRNISTFWDAQIGLRYDLKPKASTYLVVGVNGLAPYWFETQAHVFLSEKGYLSARLRQENDVLLTQKLILQPYFELNVSAQTIRDQQIGAGIKDGTIGLQTRYEFSRKFAPYLDFQYKRKLGETSSLAKKAGEKTQEFVSSFGVRLMF